MSKPGEVARAEAEGEELATIGAHPIAALRRFTPARIALGRSGNSLPTAELLDFSADHAMARDAVHAGLDVRGVGAQLTSAGLAWVPIHGAAIDRATYLRRPDLGRKLDEASREALASLQLEARPEVLFVIADGLSAIAPERYAVAVIEEAAKLLADWRIEPVLIAEQARVALGDEAGEILKAQIVVTLIGERPGLSSPDSLGLYMTWHPKIGRSDAERNCISNIRNDGMSANQAAATLYQLMVNARRLGLSGVGLKDEFDAQSAVLPGDRRVVNPKFLSEMKELAAGEEH